MLLRTVLSYAGVAFLVTAPGSSGAAELPFCTPELIAAGEKVQPDLIVTPSTFDQLEVMLKSYGCKIGVAATPKIFTSDGKQLGLLKGQVSLTGTSAPKGQGEFWVADDPATGRAVAVNSAATKFVFASGYITGIKVTSSDPSLIPYNPEPTNVGITGPEPKDLAGDLNDKLAVAYLGMSPIPSDRILVHFRSDPTGAKVWVGDVAYGNTEVSGQLRASAVSRVKLSMDGYDDCSLGDLQITADPDGYGSDIYCSLVPNPNPSP